VEAGAREGARAGEGAVGDQGVKVEVGVEGLPKRWVTTTGPRGLASPCARHAVRANQHYAHEDAAHRAHRCGCRRAGSARGGGRRAPLAHGHARQHVVDRCARCPPCAGLADGRSRVPCRRRRPGRRGCSSDAGEAEAKTPQESSASAHGARSAADHGRLASRERGKWPGARAGCCARAPLRAGDAGRGAGGDPPGGHPRDRAAPAACGRPGARARLHAGGRGQPCSSAISPAAGGSSRETWPGAGGLPDRRPLTAVSSPALRSVSQPVAGVLRAGPLSRICAPESAWAPTSGLAARSSDQNGTTPRPALRCLPGDSS